MRRETLLGAVAVVLFLAAGLPAAAARTPRVDVYRVDARTVAERSAVARTGAAIDKVDEAAVVVTATRRELRRITRLGFRATRVRLPRRLSPRPEGRPPRARAADFPAADSAYHNYAEMSNVIRLAAVARPAIARRFSLGRSYQGRELWAVKISDNVGVDESEPEVLFTCGQHGREHLTIETCLYLLNELTRKYAAGDGRIRSILNSREIFIVSNVNPDGSEYDIATGRYRFWRKNRQPNRGSSYVGTDLNRNWDYLWGCCGGASGDPSSGTFRGPFPFSAPETDAIRDFVDSRVVGGVQQIKAGIDFHSYSELVLWPYGYTYPDTAPGMSQDDQATFARLGNMMASVTGYKPQQLSDLYIMDGSIDDWLWGVHRIFGYTIELYPKTSNPGFYPPDEVITRETSRNREAVLRLLEYADCPYRVIGRAAQYCGA